MCYSQMLEEAEIGHGDLSTSMVYEPVSFPRGSHSTPVPRRTQFRASRLAQRTATRLALKSQWLQFQKTHVVADLFQAPTWCSCFLLLQELPAQGSWQQYEAATFPCTIRSSTPKSIIRIVDLRIICAWGKVNGTSDDKIVSGVSKHEQGQDADRNSYF